MPKFTRHGQQFHYATKKQTLEFANKVRKVGGAEEIEELIPSYPSEPDSCLIANALNFSCEVKTYYGGNWEKNGSWAMHVSLPEEQVKIIAEAIGEGYVELPRDFAEDPSFAIFLPEKITHVAQAFDKHLGWTKQYIKDPNILRIRED